MPLQQSQHRRRIVVGAASITLSGEKKIKRVRGVEQANKITFEQYVRLALSHARFSRNEDASWTVEVPVLPGCITWGITRIEAVEMAKDAIEAWIITALRFGDEIPAIDGCYLQYAIDEIEDVETTPRETEGSYSETAGSRV
jgi:predicted RNase H-like HicB family nuclease